MTTLYTGFEDPEGSVLQAPSSSGIDVAGSPVEQTGLGIAPSAPAVPAVPTDSAAVPEWKALVQKIGEGMYNFGAGMEGRPTWGRIQADEQRKKKAADLDELKGSVVALEHGISMTQGLEGAERDSFVAAYSKRLDGIQPGLGDTYKALSKKPDLLTQFKDYAQYLPEPMQVMMKSDTKGFLKLAGTAEGMKMLTDAKDRSDLRVATKKVQTAMLGMDKFVPPEKLKSIMADGIVTASDVMSVQQYLPKEAQLSEAEMQAVQRNDKVFWQGLGVLHGEGEQKVMAERAKRADKSTAPAHMDVDGKRYQWDPNNELPGARLKGNTKYALLGEAGTPTAGGLPKDVVATELKLSDDWRQDSKGFAERRPLFETATDYMANRDKNKTSAGDASLMFAYAKSRDPKDRLAVSETKDLPKLGNMFERFGVSVIGILEKGETLPDRVAKEMYAELRRSFTDQNRAQAKLEKQYEAKIKAYGGDPNRVIGEDRLAIKDLEKPANPKKADAVERKTIGNKTYVKKDGQWYEEH